MAMPFWNGKSQQIWNSFKLLELCIVVQWHKGGGVKIPANVLVHQHSPGSFSGLCKLPVSSCDGAGRVAFLLKSWCQILCLDSAPDPLVNVAQIVQKCVVPSASISPLPGCQRRCFLSSLSLCLVFECPFVTAWAPAPTWSRGSDLPS